MNPKLKPKHQQKQQQSIKTTANPSRSIKEEKELPKSKEIGLVKNGTTIYLRKDQRDRIYKEYVDLFLPRWF